MNYLKAVFWDYPQFADEKNLRITLKENQNSKLYFWIMGRFLGYGRVVDTLVYFKLEEIAKYFSALKLNSYTSKKWKRLLEIYGYN